MNKIFSKLRIGILIAFLLLKAGLNISRADEGMWLWMYLDKNYEEMKRLGLKLTPEDIYNVNKASLKDALVSLQFCTAELVSPQGLLLTNHHCGYDAIQQHSSVDHDYLTDGFWAKTMKDELPAAGITGSILVRMEDVTSRILKLVNDDMAVVDRSKAIQGEIAKIVADATTGNHYTAEVKGMFEGNQYFLFVYEMFTDLRLVGAPPSQIGKYGGDTDNWMWPRHTGDFSMFRIYMGPDGKPAPYSEENIPYQPKHFLPISLKGYKP